MTNYLILKKIPLGRRQFSLAVAVRSLLLSSFLLHRIPHCSLPVSHCCFLQYLPKSFHFDCSVWCLRSSVAFSCPHPIVLHYHFWAAFQAMSFFDSKHPFPFFQQATLG